MVKSALNGRRFLIKLMNGEEVLVIEGTSNFVSIVIFFSCIVTATLIVVFFSELGKKLKAKKQEKKVVLHQ